MPRKVVKVYIPKELKPILEAMIDMLGLSESEIFRYAFIKCATEYGLIEKLLKDKPLDVNYVKLS